MVEVDATGLYCALIKRANYMGHDFAVLNPNAYGPDMAVGPALRQAGYKNFTDFRVWVEHLLLDGRVGVSASRGSADNRHPV